MSDYHSDYSHVSQTMLKQFLESRRAYHGYYVAQTKPVPPPSEDMRFGTCIHAALFEPESLDGLCVEVPADVLNKDGHRKGKKYTDWEEAQGDKLILTADRAEALRECVAAVRREIGNCIDDADAVTEQIIRWTDASSGIACRMKLDLGLDLPGMFVVYDVKSSKSATWNSFRSTTENLRYWLQHAHYVAGVRAHFEIPPDKPVLFKFVPVQTAWPHWATTYPLDSGSQLTAEDARKRALADLAACHDTGVWDEPDEITREPLVMRPWAFA